MISAEEFLQERPVRIPEQVVLSSEDSDDSSSELYNEQTQVLSGTLDSDNNASEFKNVLALNGELGTFQRSDEENRCQEAALRLLDAAPRPSGALRDKLKLKGFEEEIIEVVIDRLIKVSLIDDEAYARSAVKYCINRRIGENGTFHELRRKGVDTYIARQAVNEAHEAGLFVESAYALVEYVAQHTQGLDKQVRLRRLWSAAGRKGHSPELIRQAMYEIFDDGEN